MFQLQQMHGKRATTLYYVTGKRPGREARSKMAASNVEFFSTIHKLRLGYLMECPNTIITDN